MRIISWNVNGIRAIAKKGFPEWLQSEAPDILCLQETKAAPDQLPAALSQPDGYQAHWSSSTVKKGYSGVATYSRPAPRAVREGLGEAQFDQEGRALVSEYDDFCLWNLYVPNGSRGNARVPFKMAFNDLLMKRLAQQLKQGKKIVICGGHQHRPSRDRPGPAQGESGQYRFSPRGTGLDHRFPLSGICRYLPSPAPGAGPVHLVGLQDPGPGTQCGLAH